MKIHTVLFDLDGTLIDSVDVVIASFQEALRPYLSRITKDEVLEHFGPPEEHIIGKILPKEKAQSCLESFYNIYTNKLKESVRLFPDVREMLFELNNAGIAIGIVTAKGGRMTRLTLKHLEINTAVDTVIAGTDVAKPKPSADGILLALWRLKAERKGTVYVGDSPLDILAGRAAGVTTAAALWGTRQAAKLKQANPDLIFCTIAEFKMWVFN